MITVGSIIIDSLNGRFIESELHLCLTGLNTGRGGTYHLEKYLNSVCGLASSL